MKLSLFVMISTLVLSAAEYKPGSKCGLVDSTDEYEVTTTRSLDGASKEEVLSLPTLTKQQLIIAAKQKANEYGEEPEIKNSYDAAVYLDRGRGGLTIIHALAGRTKITEIRAYPGDNASGVIFVQGTKRIVGKNSDDDVSCK